MRKLISRHRPSPAMLVALLALTVAMGGTGYAAITLPKNSVGAKQIRKNAVGASEIASGAVRSGEIGSGQVRSADIGGDQVDGSKVAADSLNAGDIDGASLDGEVGPDAFARVQDNGTLQPNVPGFPSQVKGIDAADVVKGEGTAATGNYCFGGLGFRPATAQATLDNADAALNDRNLVVSIALDRGEDLGDCPASHNAARVRIFDGNTGVAQNARFFIWFER